MRKAFSIGFLFLAFCAYPQLSSTHKKATKLYAKADKAYKERDFDLALEQLEEAGRLDTTFFEAYSRMGSLYSALGNIDSVYAKLKHYLVIAPNESPNILERMAFMAFDRGHYAQSAAYLDRLVRKVPSKSQGKEIILLQESQAFVKAQLANVNPIAINEMPEAINRFDLQYLPTMTVDKSTLVYTKRDFVSDDEDIVVSYQRQGKWTPAASISSRINTSLNEGACSISGDGRMMIFTACDRRNSLGSCDLYITQKIGDNWSRPKNLGNPINSKYWESQPSLSADGNVLYFVSNRPGGLGGRDIWFSKREGEKWTKPQNLGDAINTFKDDTTPFIHFSGQSLFYSSNGYPGMGGFDLFKVDLMDSVWSKPQNLGYPINSFKDEVALLIDAGGEEGFFAKEVKKGREISDSKIVRMTLPAFAQPERTSYVVGSVYDAETQQPLKGSVEVIDLNTGKFLYKTFSDSLSGQFYMVLPSNRELGGYVKKKGYLYEDFSFVSDAKRTDSLRIYLSKIQAGESLILRNIYFQTNSYRLSNKSDVEVDNAVKLLLENPKITIRIEGHTDDIGGEDYNLSLSERRAQAVYKVLQTKGISASRLSFKGFGSQKPLVPNNSDTNRRYNRRIEFRVLRTKQ